MTEWFICLSYEKYDFLIPHTYNSQNEEDPEIFIDFDQIALNFFSTENKTKHPAAITIKAKRKAMLTTSAIPAVKPVDLKGFQIPDGILEEPAKKNGIIAVCFTSERINVIINPELLYERWSRHK